MPPARLAGAGRRTRWKIIAVWDEREFLGPEAAAALPFLVDLAARPATHDRGAVLATVHRLVYEGSTLPAEQVDPGWPAAVVAELPGLLALLDDPEPAIRREAANLLASGGLPVEPVVAALWRRHRTETDPGARLDLLIAFGAMLDRVPGSGDIRAELHRLLDDPDRQTGLAAVHALAGTEPGLPGTRLDRLIAAVLDPGTVRWRDTYRFGGSAQAVTNATGDLLRGDPDARRAFALAVGAGGGSAERAAALNQVRVLLERRDTAPALHGFLIERLADGEPEVRFRAAYLLGCVPTPDAADALAALAASAGRDGDAAVWALARLGDARCVPPLLDRLTAPSLVFGTAPGYATSLTFHLPSVDEILSPLRSFAAGLLPGVTPAIGAGRAVHPLCRVLGAWGAAAAPAVPLLATLLGRPEHAEPAAEALGGIGRAASAAGPRLRKRFGWAYWRVTGDPAGALDGSSGITRLRRLGELGRRAADTAGALRFQATRADEDDVVRAEAAYTHFRVTGDPAVAVAVLTGLARPLARGRCEPGGIAALEYLAAIGTAAKTAAPIARAVLDSPHRLSCLGGWHVFDQDERLRLAAADILLAR